MNAAIEAWKAEELEISRDFAKRMREMTPEPLFETPYMPGHRKVCLACCNNVATSTLWSGFAGRSIVPMCKGCASDWNFHGYYILKRLTPLKMAWRLLKYKILHPWGRPTPIDIALDVMAMLRWSKKMSRLMKLRKSG